MKMECNVPIESNGVCERALEPWLFLWKRLVFIKLYSFFINIIHAANNMILKQILMRYIKSTMFCGVTMEFLVQAKGWLGLGLFV